VRFVGTKNIDERNSIISQFSRKQKGDYRYLYTMKKAGLFLWLILFIHHGFSQTVFNGIIKDQDTKLAIPYAAVGILGTAKGAITDQYGNFQFNPADLHEKDTIVVSAIGYEKKIIPVFTLKGLTKSEIFLQPIAYDLSEVKVKPKKYKVLGTSKYSKGNCSAFMGKERNWKGEQAAIQANNDTSSTVYFESFSFYIIKNEYNKPLTFRVMLYSIGYKGYPGASFLKKPILFSTNVKEGEVVVDLTEYNLSYKGDFFISLECLEDEMDASKFCFAGSIKVPSYFRSAFGRWGRVKGGGGDFNVKVRYGN
jgi:hypothetical protein